jgi:hypothetical protein
LFSLAVQVGLQPRGAALTTNLKKALFFEKSARKTQNKARRERLLRAARRYLLAAAKDLEPLPRPPPRIKKDRGCRPPDTETNGSAFRQWLAADARAPSLSIPLLLGSARRQVPFWK